MSISTTGRDRRRQAIRTTLLLRLDGATDANAVAEATLLIWSEVVKRLEPVIGVRGVSVLLARALHLTRRLFPPAMEGADGIPHDHSLTAFQSWLAYQDATNATDASCALFVTFTDLLVSLIGNPLTERLLSNVWVSLPRMPSPP